MKGKVCGDFCEFTLDKGHFITGEWIKLLGDMFGFAENSTLSVENYEFADTKEDKEYGYLAEVANVYSSVFREPG